MSSNISRFRRAKNKDLDSDITSEKLMLLTAIISDEFCRSVGIKYKPEFVQNEFIRKTMDWCLSYYTEFKKAPGKKIEQVFEYKSSELDDSSKELIEYLLFSLSQSTKGTGVSDFHLVLKETLKYFRKRHLDIALKKSRVLYDKGKIDKAIESLVTENFQNDLTSEGKLENIFTRFSIEQAWSRTDTSHVFSFTGALEGLNRLTGFIKRGWLMAYLAPPKRGKTSWLLETACQAMVYGRKVLFVSLEMNSEAIRQRFYSRFLSKPAGSYRDNSNFITDSDGTVLSKIPYIDCVHNKDNTCKRQEREDFKSNIHVERVEDLQSVPCFACVRSIDSDFSMTIEVAWEALLDDSYESDHRKLLAIGRHLGRYLRLVTYPSFLGGIDDIQQDLEIAKSQGFIPDVIIIDYADILRPPAGGRDERQNLDIIWKTLKGLSEATNSVVITASQTNRGALEQKRIDQKHIAEDFRKIAHVDVFLALNQSNFEKEAGIKRINAIAHRHKDFSPFTELFVSEALHMGQVCVNSVMPPKKQKKEEDEEDDT